MPIEASKRRTWLLSLVGGAVLLAVVVVVLLIVNRSSHSPPAGRDAESTASAAGPASTVSAAVATTAGTSVSVATSQGVATAVSTPAAGGGSRSLGAATKARPGNESTVASSPPSPADTSSADAGNSVVACTSADFGVRANRCGKVDSQVAASNGGLTVDGDLSFPDYMVGTISLLQKKGTSWHRLGEFSTKTYPDVVVIDSKKFISVQLANVFAYGGHRAMPACSTAWGIEVDDAQGLPLGDVMFTYVCR